MANYCSNCGKPVGVGDVFCTECGAATGEKLDLTKNVSELPEGITVDENGAYHWTYRLNMLKNPVPLITLIKLIFSFLERSGYLRQ